MSRNIETENFKRKQLMICASPAFRETKNGGLVLGEDEFQILDDNIKRILMERYYEEGGDRSKKLQSTSEVKEILLRKPYVQISEVLLLGVKVIVVEESPVPSFAWNAYKKMEDLNRPDMQKLIIAAAESYSVLEEEQQQEIKGRIFVGKQSDTCEERFEVLDLASFARIQYEPQFYFVFGDLASHANLRISKPPARKFFEMEVMVDFKYRFIEEYNFCDVYKFIIDTGASESSFPGYQNKRGVLTRSVPDGTEREMPDALLLPRSCEIANSAVSDAVIVAGLFTLKVDNGTTEPWEVKLEGMLAHKSGENADIADIRQTKLLLGLDFLLQTTGCWTSLGNGTSVLNLERLPENNSKESVGGVVKGFLSSLKQAGQDTLEEIVETGNNSAGWFNRAIAERFKR